ncbi:MAG: cation transporter [Sedimentisphaerales bacterium]|nr:cation transporter [Sedimentisphaerales bacterium]
MISDKREISEIKIKTVTYIGMCVNSGLSLIKIIIGYLAGSLALIADGIHSLSDLATDLAVLLGVRIGSKQADSSHPYGHGRAETFAGGFVALILIFVGGIMIYYATIAIAKDEVTKPNYAVLIAAILSVVAKEWLYRATKKIAVESHSPSVYANAWHHRSDAFSSVAVVIGFITLVFGFSHGDQVAAIAVGLMIIWIGIKVISDTFRELTEGSIDNETIEMIKNIINADSSIQHWHQLRSRTVGREVFLDVHILVDPELNVAAAHDISENLEKSLEKQISRPINITVHIEPDIPEMRKE